MRGYKNEFGPALCPSGDVILGVSRRGGRVLLLLSIWSNLAKVNLSDFK